MIQRLNTHGFTIIEVLIFIVVTSLLMSTMLLGAYTALRKSPDVHHQIIALQTAERCMEYFLDQRRLNGYGALSCPSSPTASACSAPSGFSVGTSVACTTWNSDAAFKTITVSVTGLSAVTLSTQIGGY